MFIGYEQAAATNAAKTIAAFPNMPANTTQVELQADTQNVRYTMDGSTPTQNVGMLLLVTEPPKLFGVEDFLRIRFIRGTGTDGVLNAHYLAGRDV